MVIKVKKKINFFPCSSSLALPLPLSDLLPFSSFFPFHLPFIYLSPILVLLKLSLPLFYLSRVLQAIIPRLQGKEVVHIRKLEVCVLKFDFYIYIHVLHFLFILSIKELTLLVFKCSMFEILDK